MVSCKGLILLFLLYFILNLCFNHSCVWTTNLQNFRKLNSQLSPSGASQFQQTLGPTQTQGIPCDSWHTVDSTQGSLEGAKNPPTTLGASDPFPLLTRLPFQMVKVQPRAPQLLLVVGAFLKLNPGPSSSWPGTHLGPGFQKVLCHKFILVTTFLFCTPTTHSHPASNNTSLPFSRESSLGPSLIPLVASIPCSGPPTPWQLPCPSGGKG